MGQLEIRIKTKGDGLAGLEELAKRHRLQEEIERRGIGRDLGGGSGFGEMDISVEVTSELSGAKSKLRALAEELGIEGNISIEENGRTVSEIEKKAGRELLGKKSRKQAFADGILVDVTEIAKQAGFKIPVGLSRTVFEEYVADLWDLLCNIGAEIECSKGDCDEILVTHMGQSGIEETVNVAIGEGDDGEPVITVFMKREG